MQTSLFETRGRITPTQHIPMGWEVAAGVAAAAPQLPRLVLCHIRSGSALFRFEGWSIPLAAPAVLLLSDVMRPHISQAKGLQMANVHFHPAVINSAFAPDLIRTREQRDRFEGSAELDLYLIRRFMADEPQYHYYTLGPHVHERVGSLFEQMVREAQMQNRQWVCRTRAFFIELLFQVRMLEPDESRVALTAPGSHHSRVDRALLFLQERYNSEFTLGELARTCFTNRTTLNAEFRAATGMTVRAYATSLRMKVAAAMLRDTALPVAEIMNRVGYTNHSHFTRAFRHSVGIAPSEYRANRS